MKNVKEIEIEVKGKDWDKILDQAFNKKKKDIKIPGFRKGAVSKDVYIKKVGIESLFMDACDIAVEDAYKKALKEADIELACEPSVSIEAVSKDAAKFKFTLIGHPEVKLGKYTKLGIKKETAKVTKEEIEHEIEHLLDHMAEIVNKENGTVEMGNTAVIDFEGKVDGKVIDGGTVTNYPLEIGSNSFIPGFEEGLVGMSIGDKKLLKLKFPDNYVESLKGKDVEFSVTIKEIKQRVKPKIDKDFFLDLGVEGVDSKEKLEKHLKEELLSAKNQELENKYIDELIHKACDNMTVEINDEIIHGEVHRMIHQYEHDLSHQGASLDQYLAMTGMKIDDLENMMKPQAEARIKTRYLLEAVADKEKIKVTKDDIKKYVSESSQKYEMKEDEFISAVGGEDAIEYDLRLNKALDIIKEG